MTTVAAAHSGIELTPKGEVYVAANINAFAPGGCPAGIEPRVWRQELETRVELYLGIVTGLLAMLDDGLDPDLEPDEDLEPSIGGQAPWSYEVDLELDDMDRKGDGLEAGERDDSDLDSGWIIPGGNECGIGEVQP